MHATSLVLLIIAQLVVNLQLQYSAVDARSKNIPSLLLLSTPSDIWHMELATNELDRLWIFVRNFRYIEVSEDCLMFVDYDELEIRRQCFRPQEVLHKASVGEFGGIAYDWVSQMLYFTNKSHANIEVISTAETPYRAQMHRILVQLEIDSVPAGIAVHPRRGYLFWACYGGGKIMRANMDGSEVRTLIQSPDISQPLMIIVDLEIERIFWTDRGHQNIASCDSNGEQFQVILAAKHPYDLAIVNESIFWTEPNAHTLRKAIVKEYHSDGIKLLTSRNVSTVVENILYFNIRFISNITQSETNACSKANECSHACVGSPNNTYTCICPQGMQLIDGGQCGTPGGTNSTCRLNNTSFTFPFLSFVQDPVGYRKSHVTAGSNTRPRRTSPCPMVNMPVISCRSDIGVVIIATQLMTRTATCVSVACGCTKCRIARPSAIHASLTHTR